MPGDIRRGTLVIRRHSAPVCTVSYRLCEPRRGTLDLSFLTRKWGSSLPCTGLLGGGTAGGVCGRAHRAGRQLTQVGMPGESC